MQTILLHKGKIVMFFPFDNRKLWSWHAIFGRIATFHPWLSPFNVPLRFGKFSTVASTSFVFLALTLLMTWTLMGYILTSNNVTDNFSMEIEFVIMTVIVGVAVNLIMYLLSILMRNIKSGKKEIIDNLFPKSYMSDKNTDGENYDEKQGEISAFKKNVSQVHLSITHFPSVLSRRSSHSAKIGDKQMSDTFMSIDLQSEQNDNIVSDKHLSKLNRNLDKDEDIVDVGSSNDRAKHYKGVSNSSTYLEEGNRDVFKSSTDFEVCRLEEDSSMELIASDQKKSVSDMNVSFISLDQFRDVEQDSNNSADKDGNNMRKKNGKMERNDTKSSEEDVKMYAYGRKNDKHEPAKRPVEKVDASNTSLSDAELFDEFKFLDIESDAFLDVAHSESKMKGNGQLHSVSNEWQSNVDTCLKDCAYSLSLPCTVKQQQMLTTTESDLLQAGCEGGRVQDTLNREEESLQNSSFLPKTEEFLQNSFSKPKTEESTGSYLSRPNEDGFAESPYSKPIIPSNHSDVDGKVEHMKSKEQCTSHQGPRIKDGQEGSPTFQDISQDHLSCDEVSIHMYTAGEADSLDEEELFLEIENKASVNQFCSISIDEQTAISDSGMRDESTCLHSVLLPQKNLTFSESDEVQQQINRRNTQLQGKARMLSLQLLLHFCEIRRLLLTCVDSSIIYHKTKVAARTWMTSLIEEQLFSVLHTNRILAIQRDHLAVKMTGLGDEVLEWPQSQNMGARCIKKCIQHVCEAMAFPRHQNFRQRLDRGIQDTLTQHLYDFTQQFHDHLKQNSKWTHDLWSSVSTDDSMAYNLTSVYVSQSSPQVLQHKDNFPTLVVSKSAEYMDSHLHELSYFYMECVQKCFSKDEGKNFSVSVMPMPTCSGEDQEEVQVLLGPPQFSRSFKELSLESQLYRVALDGAMKELWLEYQDPVTIYTTFLMQAVTLDKLKTVLPYESQENLTSDHDSAEVLNGKQHIHGNKHTNIDNQDVEGSEPTRTLRATLSGKLATYSGALSRKLSLLRESKSALITLLSKKSETTAKKNVDLHPLIPCLDKKWHQLGFHHSLNVQKSLTQALMSKLVKDLKKEQDKSILSKENLALESVSCFYRIEKELFSELDKCATACFERWCPYIQQIVADFEIDTWRTRDQVCAVVDVAGQEMLASLDSIVRDLVKREIVEYTATQAIQNSISQTFSKADKLQIPVTDNGEAATSYEMNLAELIKDFQPLRIYLSRVTTLEKLISKEVIKANFLDRYQQKHNKFAAITLQHVLDSYYEKDLDKMDTSLTNDTLQQLEWHVLQENTKVIPSIFGRLVTFMMFCVTVFCLVYVTLTGGSLTVTQIQEWVSCFCISIALYGFILEPFVAVVGYLRY
ncbi:uncharacterized protein LOC117316250 [Pecten maximus]|uniref:uncharacterized protein LOC117316250 n=1 Tax=Pecten maximus TaxID=6579 RepID=UPI001458CDDF|nr:uncharacterized protein LOC117316250 [Pecten maximus]